MNIGDMGVPFIYQGEELIHPNPVKDGLVLWYDFSGMTNDDESKDIARDLSGNGNHGTLQNFNFTPESGYDKNKLSFDGTDDRIRTSNAPLVNIDGSLTLEVVFSINAETDPKDVVGWDWIISNSSNAGATTGYAIVREPNGEMKFKYGAISISITHSFSNYREQHVACVFDSVSSTYFIYVNGILVEERLRIDAKPQKTIYPLGIGTTFYYTPAPHSAITVGSAKIYDKALTSEEIAHNYTIEKERFSIE